MELKPVVCSNLALKDTSHIKIDHSEKADLYSLELSEIKGLDQLTLALPTLGHKYDSLST